MALYPLVVCALNAIIYSEKCLSTQALILTNIIQIHTTHFTVGLLYCYSRLHAALVYWEVRLPGIPTMAGIWYIVSYYESYNVNKVVGDYRDTYIYLVCVQDSSISYWIKNGATISCPTVYRFEVTA